MKLIILATLVVALACFFQAISAMHIDHAAEKTTNHIDNTESDKNDKTNNVAQEQLEKKSKFTSYKSFTKIEIFNYSYDSYRRQ